MDPKLKLKIKRLFLQLEMILPKDRQLTMNLLIIKAKNVIRLNNNARINQYLFVQRQRVLDSLRFQKLMILK